MSSAFVPVSLGGRAQSVSATSVVAITPSDVVSIGPCSRLLVTVAGNLVLGMWDGSTVTLAVVAGQSIDASPKLVHVGTTATVFAEF